MFLACALVASQIRLAKLANPPFHSAAAFDQQMYDLTAETLSRDICPRLDARYVKMAEPQRTFHYEMDQRAASKHCQVSFEQHGMSGGTEACGAAFSRQ